MNSLRIIKFKTQKGNARTHQKTYHKACISLDSNKSHDYHSLWCFHLVLLQDADHHHRRLLHDFDVKHIHACIRTEVSHFRDHPPAKQMILKCRQKNRRCNLLYVTSCANEQDMTKFCN